MLAALAMTAALASGPGSSPLERNLVVLSHVDAASDGEVLTVVVESGSGVFVTFERDGLSVEVEVNRDATFTCCVFIDRQFCASAHDQLDVESARQLAASSWRVSAVRTPPPPAASSSARLRSR